MLEKNLTMLYSLGFHLHACQFLPAYEPLINPDARLKTIVTNSIAGAEDLSQTQKIGYLGSEL